ncbi:ribosome maturation factor RimM [Imbroritus primus]|uniref:Ribosome maturation factor RimM n=1 Tax=Imbroritus primus TaxID=3058603 RepID=A0ACD3STM3_9BURK|nr:ribosome maturation factor RimM [Burkholderiaceae bacterium PBA]
MQGAFRPRRTSATATAPGQAVKAVPPGGDAFRHEPPPDDLVDVGYISGAHGVRGWLKAQPHSSDAAAMLAARTWWLRPRAATGQPGQLASAKVLQAREHSGSVVVQLEQLTDRTQAEQFKGHVVAVRRADFPAPADDEFYWVDLIGASVVNLQDEALGVVEGLLDNGAQQILRVVSPAVAGGAQEERLIPFVKTYVHSVDAKAGRIVVDWGLDY